MNSFKSILYLVVVMMVTASVGYAQENTDVRFAYDVDFETYFDNREFYRSSFSRSSTIFGARLTPSVGLAFQSSEDMRHKVMIGIDIMKDFGASVVSPEIASPDSEETLMSQHHKDLFREVTLYYKLDKKLEDTDLELYAGIFPRNMSDGNYSEVFFSDSLKFYDNNLEGILLKLKRPKARFEIGCDWMGMYGHSRREKFMIFSSAEAEVAPVLSLGYLAYMYHFASSEDVRGVVDNILINPYARFDFGHLLGFQLFTLRLGWLQGLQNDRRNIGAYCFPRGGELELEMMKWNVGVRNKMFYGMDMMPYYNRSDVGGFKYGNRLYFGDPFYRMHDGDGSGPAFYDRLEFYWIPYKGDLLDISIGAMFHFHDFHYSGCQQVVQMNIDLHQIISNRRTR